MARFTERDRIEAEGQEFHQAVRKMFLQLARSESERPERYLVLSADQPIEVIAAAVRDAVLPLLNHAARNSAGA